MSRFSTASYSITGGENVYPSEVENVLREHPAMQEVAVIGVPDPKWGERIIAVVAPRPPAQADQKLARALVEFTGSHIAGYKKPKAIEFIAPEEMPRTPTGKILHRALRDRFGA